MDGSSWPETVRTISSSYATRRTVHRRPSIAAPLLVALAALLGSDLLTSPVRASILVAADELDGNQVPSMGGGPRGMATAAADATQPPRPAAGDDVLDHDSIFNAGGDSSAGAPSHNSTDGGSGGVACLSSRLAPLGSPPLGERVREIAAKLPQPPANELLQPPRA